MSFKPKLAETASLFCRVQFKNGTKLADTALLVSGQHTKGYKERILFATCTCTLAATCCGGHPVCVHIASFPGLLHLQFLIVYGVQNSVSDQKLMCRRPGNEARHALMAD